MSESKIKGRDWIFSISEDGGTTYKPLACLTTKGFTSSQPEIDASSQCGNEFIPGDKMTQSADAEGFVITQTGTPAKISGSKVYDLQIDKTVFKFRMRRASPIVGEDYKYEGDCFITEFEESSPDGELNTFTCTIMVAKPPLTQTLEA
jgi:hypothetical protein